MIVTGQTPRQATATSRAALVLGAGTAMANASAKATIGRSRFHERPKQRRRNDHRARRIVTDAEVAEVGNPAKEFRMSIIGWLILGLIAGFIASKLVNKEGSGLVPDIVLGIIGALVGGFLFTQLGGIGIT